MEIKWKILTYSVWIQMEIFWQPYILSHLLKLRYVIFIIFYVY